MFLITLVSEMQLKFKQLSTPNLNLFLAVMFISVISKKILKYLLLSI